MSTNGTHRLKQNLESLAPTVACSEPFIYREYLGEGVDYARKPVIIESAWPLIINGQNWLTVLCTPTKLDYFVLGFLHNEGLITNPEEVLHLQIDQPPEGVIRVELQDRGMRLPERRTLTSGCGGGITFVDLAAAREPICSSRRVTARQVSGLMSELMAAVADDYRRVGGFHTAGLSDGHQLLVVSTDIGRHNTLDKVAGECLARDIPMHDAVLLTTGRVSVEMLGKAARMQVPIVATLNSPTHLAVELAREWHITLIGYARGTKMHIYTGWQRILDATPVASPEQASRTLAIVRASLR
jgi:FdhD protein